MSNHMKAMMRSWFNIFMSAVITAVLVVLTSNDMTIPLDGEIWLGVLIAGVVAVLPVIKNYFDSSDTRYGRGSDTE